MLDLSGYPELGILAILYYCAGGHLKHYKNVTKTDNIRTTRTGVYFPISSNDSYLECIFQQWKTWYEIKFLTTTNYTDGDKQQQQQSSNNCYHIPNANQVLEFMEQKRKQTKTKTWEFLNNDYHLDLNLVYFWENEKLQNSPVLQMLLLKLYYTSWTCCSLFLPLACFAVPFVQHKTSIKEYKSHLAYQTLITSIVLGKRMKVHRQEQYKLQNQYHIPIWNVVFHQESRHPTTTQTTTTRWNLSHVTNVIEYLQQLIIMIQQQITTTNMCVKKEAISKVVTSWWGDDCKPLFVVGDSHVVSIGWQTISSWKDDDVCKILVPVVITGLKAWHVRFQTNFFTQTNLQTQFQLFLRDETELLVSAGEIDCREGIGGPSLQGYTQSCTSNVSRTVQEYVTSLSKFNTIPQIYVMPVAPHAHRSKTNGKSHGRAKRRECTQLWNQTLNTMIDSSSNNNDNNLFFLDYASQLVLTNEYYVLNPVYNADYTHMNSAFLYLLEQTMMKHNHRHSNDKNINNDL